MPFLEPLRKFPVYVADFGPNVEFTEPGETDIQWYKTGDNFPWDFRTTYLSMMNCLTLTEYAHDYFTFHEAGGDEPPKDPADIRVDVVAVDTSGEEKFGVCRYETGAAGGGIDGFSPFRVIGGGAYSLTDEFLPDGVPRYAAGLKVKVSIIPPNPGVIQIPVTWKFVLGRPMLFYLTGPDNFQNCFVDD